MRPQKTLLARHTIALRWRDRLKVLFTGKVYVFLAKTRYGGAKIHGAGV